jgi:hypothetical protein
MHSSQAGIHCDKNTSCGFSWYVTSENFLTKIYFFFKTLISHYDLGTCFRTWLPVDIFFSESYNLEDFSTYGASKTDGLRVRQMVNYMAELLLEVSY